MTMSFFPELPSVEQLQYLLQAGDPEAVIALWPDLDEPLPEPYRPVFAMAYVLRGDELVEEAVEIDDSESAEKYFETAIDAFMTAHCIDPKGYRALLQWGELLAYQAELVNDSAEAMRLYRQAIDKYEEAGRWAPEEARLLNSWGVALYDLSRIAPDAEVEGLLEQALSRQEKALSLEPQHPEYMTALADTLSRLADYKEAEEALSLLRVAVDYYEQACAITPEDVDCLIGMGNALDDLAALSTPEEADQLRQTAGSHYAQAVLLDDDDDITWYNWGILLARQARTRQGEAARALALSATEKYQRAHEIDPQNASTLLNWGDVLCTLAELSSGAEAVFYYEDACRKYEAAAVQEGGEGEFYAAWGNALFQLSRCREGRDAEVLRKESIEKYLISNRMQPEDADTLYNLSIVLSHCDEKNKRMEAVGYLEQAIGLMEAACREYPEDYQMLLLLGNALSDLARLKGGRESLRLFQQSNAYYERVRHLVSDSFVLSYNWGLMQMRWAKYSVPAQRRELLQHAIEHFEAAAAFFPENADTFSQWAEARLLLAETTEEEGALYLPEVADRLKTALRLNPEDKSVRTRLPEVLIDFAETQPPEVASLLYEEAIKRCAENHRNYPDSPDILHQWGCALRGLAELEEGEKAIATYREAYRQLEKAAGYEPENSGVWTVLGMVLREMGCAMEEAGEQVLLQATEKFQKALAIKPDIADALCEWGGALCDLAGLKDTPESRFLLEEACAKCAAAAELEPENAEILAQWGVALMDYSAALGGDDAGYEEALAILSRAEGIEEGIATYNLACAYAVLGREGECRCWLEKAFTLENLPDRDFIENDPDLLSVRNKEWFQALLGERCES